MAVDFTKKIFSDTYKDDFRDSDNYHRILFNSGKALQARELTQLQTIIQREMERLGSHVFKEGAAVNPGGITVNTNYEFVKLNTTVNGLPNTPSDLIGQTITGNDTGVKGVILDVVASTVTDPATLYIRYTKTNTPSVSQGTSPVKFNAGEDITSSGGDTYSIQTTNTTANPAFGTGTRISVHRGDFYVQGHFVFAPEQSIIIDKYSGEASATVGFKVIQDIVRAEDTDALYDNQGALPNRSAPGADRYRIRLQLTDKTDVDSDENFVFYGEIRRGVITESVTGFDDYNKIADALARRTSEINGDFTTKQFKIKFDENESDNSKIDLDISTGVTYINGYRSSNNTPRTITLDKARETETLNNEVVAADYGNYVLIDSLKTVPNIQALQDRNLRDALNHGGSTIGIAKVRAVEEDGAGYRMYLFDIDMNSGKNFRDVRSIGASSADYANVKTTLRNGVSQAVLSNPAANNLLFELPTGRPKQLTDISLEVQRRYTGTFDNTGAASLTLTAAGENFGNTNQWIITVDSSGAVISSDVSISGVGTQAVNLSNGPTSTNFEALVKVNKGQGSIRNKTLQIPNTLAANLKPASTSTNGTFVDSALESDGTGLVFLDLRKPDLFEVDFIRDGDSEGQDISNRFVIDNGQRDNSYIPSRIILKTGAEKPTGDVAVAFKYFTHGASGDFFAVNSYTGQVEYDKIPNHTLADGTVINLRDVLDFRPRKTDDAINFLGGTARVNELPTANDLITTDVEYYLPRYDKLIINETGQLSVVKGRSSLSPKYPETPAGTAELYRLKLNPYVLNDSDLDTDLIETKGFTMKDIGKLETRLDQLEEIATLSALELNVRNFSVFDSTGADRTKAGFLVDNFSDHLSSNTRDEEYRAAIDPRNRILRPTFAEDQIPFQYDSDLSTNTIKKGDNVYIKYTETRKINQPLYSGTMNINPFQVITHKGRLNLSPQSDDWREVNRIPPRIIDGGFRLDPRQNTLWNNWEWQWGGTDINNLSGRELGRNSRTTNSSSAGGGGVTFSTTTTTAVTRIVTGETIREVIGDRVLDVAVIPFMRSRKIYFKAQGLKPETRLFAFFDGKDVSDWVREETFRRISDDPQQYGSRHNNATQHPEGKTIITTDANGAVEGSFFIPNGSALKFRCGDRVLRFLDITVDKKEDATAIASSIYSATGILETRQEDIRSTRNLNIVTNTNSSTSSRFVRNPPPQDNNNDGDGGGDGGSDPLAQSFFVDAINGMFVTKVGVRFATRDEQIPVQLELRTMVNGHPNAYDTIPGSVIFKNLGASDISADGTKITYFEFDEPIMLEGRREYAIVLKAETIGYNVYVGETGEFIFGSTERRITQQPSLGSLFKSQNSFTWEPAQNADLSFELYTAVFDTDATVIMENVDPGPSQLITDPIAVTNGVNTATVTHRDHGFKKGDEVVLYGLDSSTRYSGILGKSIIGSRTIDSADNDFFRIDLDSDATSTANIGGRAIQASRQILYETVIPAVQTMTPEGTRLQLAAIATTGFSSVEQNNLTSSAYIKGSTYIPLSMYENNFYNAPQLVPSAEQRTSNLASGIKSNTMSIVLQSGDENLSPVVDMQRASQWLVHNRIDFQSTNGDSSGRNNPITYVPETDPGAGSALAKHITRPVTLVEDAVGLKILLSANRPSVTDFKVYFKTLQEGQTFSDTNWEEVVRQVTQPTDDNPNIFREYEYLVGGDTGLDTPFTRFALKIVMFSSNNARVPVFQDLRVIALIV